MINFDLPKDQSSIIKVIGVGGGGSNAVNHMFRQGIKGVDFIVCNTDQQALDISPVPYKIALGAGLTEGRGAGSQPEMGKKASMESVEEIKKLLSHNTKMVFITAGLGGGTGTGGAPVIAQIAKEMGILTVAIVTVPFAFEGKKRKQQAEDGLKELRQHVDTILIINNDKLREMYGNLKLTEAFAHADNILNQAAKSIAEIITVTLHINLDFADVQTVMTNSGVAIMGSASAEGENRALRAVESALTSPLLNDNNIKGARYVLLNITCGTDDITMDELGQITDYLQDAAGQTADIIKGYGIDPSLGDKVNVTLIATGFSSVPVTAFAEKKAEKIIRRLDENVQTAPVASAPVVSKPVVSAPVAVVPPVVQAAPVVPTPVAIVPPVVQAAPVIPTPVAVVPPVVSEPVAFVPPVVETPVINIPVAVVPPIISTPVASVPPVVHHLVEETKPVEQVKPVEEVNQESSLTPFMKTEEVVDNSNVEFEIIHKAPVENKTIEVPMKPIEPPVFVSQTVQQTEEHNDMSDAVVSEDQKKKAQERIEKLKQLSYKLRTPGALSDLENEPAYKRKNVQLEETQHSSESSVSRYTLSEGEDKKTELKPNNGFLHDNVD
jgi:cell division protein FtsZ